MDIEGSAKGVKEEGRWREGGETDRERVRVRGKKDKKRNLGVVGREVKER